MTAQFVATTNAGTNSATTLAVSVPSGVVDGDYLIAALSHGRTGEDMTSAGWTALTGFQGNNGGATISRMNAFIKVALGEPSSYTFGTLGGATSIAGVMCAWRGFAGIIGAANVGASGSAVSNLAAPSISTLYGSSTLVTIHASSGTTALSTPGGMTSRGARTIGVFGPAIIICDEIRTAGGATGTRTSTGAASSAMSAWIIEYQPSAWGAELFTGL